MKTFATLLFMGLTLTGCHTIAPRPVLPPVLAAYDGSFADAGVPAAVNPIRASNGSVIGWRVTAFWLVAYKARVAQWGKDLVPAMTAGNCLAGIYQMPDLPGRGPTWFVPNAAQAADGDMAALARNSR